MPRPTTVMSATRIAARFSRTVMTQCLNTPLFFDCHYRHCTSFFANVLFSHDKALLVECSSRALTELLNRIEFSSLVVTGQVLRLHHSAQNSSVLQWFGFSKSASPQPNEKETTQSINELENKANNEDGSAVTTSDQREASVTEEKIEPDSAIEPQSNKSGTIKRRTRGTKRIAFSDSDSDLESDLSRDDLLKLVTKKEQPLGTKQEELEKMKDKVLRTFAEVENARERTRHESENAKKFAIQKFAKSLLDVADNLGRASSAAKESFSKIDASKVMAGAVQQLKTLLEGVEMTEKQLSEVFKKFGLEKYDPLDEEFDPNRHTAVFQVTDPSKPAEHVAVVLKARYMLHARVIRPAEVCVTVAISRKLNSI